MMRLVTAACEVGDVVLGRDAIPAGTPMVMPRHGAVHLACQMRDAGLPAPRVSRMGYYTRPYCGQELGGDTSLLAWRGAGIGDQLLVAGVLAMMARTYDGAVRLGMMADPNVVASLYQGAENLPFEVLPEPLTLADWRSWDYHWLVDGYCDGNHEPNQPDVWDGMLEAIGWSGFVPPEECRVWVPESRAWTARARAFLKTTKAMAAVQGRRGPVIVWQLAASTPMRSLAPAHTAECLRALLAAMPEAVIILTGHESEYESYAEACGLEGIAGTSRGLKLQEAFALVREADLVVCPDSCLGHVAAAYEVPAVSLWCPFPWTSRATYYASHRPVVPAELPACAPCWAHEYGPINQQRGCPLTESDPAAVKWCKGLAAIRPEAIVEAVRKEIG